MPICFDLDGTLGCFGGGYVLLRQALGQMWGEEPTAEDLKQCSGSTDWELVDELHRRRFGTPLSTTEYEQYERACLERFEATFHDEGRKPDVFSGLVQGMSLLMDRGHCLWLVSGNVPRVLDFKARLLGVDDRIRRLGSLYGFSREALLRLALQGCPGPHLYVGDRPHDRDAASAAGMPFLGVGELVPGDHPILSQEAEAQHLMKEVESLVRR